MTARRLSGIEALRGVAATAVVLSHAARHVDRVRGAHRLAALFGPLHAGVDLFFVISGFIILFVHRPDLGRPDRIGRYLSRRATRILPLYWIALALTVLMAAAGGHAWPSAGALLWSASLLPTRDEPILGIAWTLQFELVFYAVFAASILDRRAGSALLAAWLALIALATAGAVGPGLPPALCGSYGLEFFMGMAAAAWLEHGPVPAPGSLALLGAAGFGAALLSEGARALDGFGPAGRFAYGGTAALLVLGIAAAERRGRLAIAPALRRLGGASYSIYLFQFVLIGLLWQALRGAGIARAIPPSALFALLALGAVAGGIAIARGIEAPLLRALRPRRPALAEPVPG